MNDRTNDTLPLQPATLRHGGTLGDDHRGGLRHAINREHAQRRSQHCGLLQTGASFPPVHISLGGTTTTMAPHLALSLVRHLGPCHAPLSHPRGLHRAAIACRARALSPNRSQRPGSTSERLASAGEWRADTLRQGHASGGDALLHSSRRRRPAPLTLFL